MTFNGDPSFEINKLIKNPSFDKDKEVIDKIEEKYTMQNYEHTGKVKEIEADIEGLESNIELLEMTMTNLNKSKESLMKSLISDEIKDDEALDGKLKEITKSISDKARKVKELTLKIEELKLKITN